MASKRGTIFECDAPGCESQVTGRTKAEAMQWAVEFHWLVNTVTQLNSNLRATWYACCVSHAPAAMAAALNAFDESTSWFLGDDFHPLPRRGRQNG